MRVSVAPHLVGCCLHWRMRRAYRINHNAHFITLLSANRLKQVHCMAFIISCYMLRLSMSMAVHHNQINLFVLFFYHHYNGLLKTKRFQTVNCLRTLFFFYFVAKGWLLSQAIQPLPPPPSPAPATGAHGQRRLGRRGGAG